MHNSTWDGALFSPKGALSGKHNLAAFPETLFVVGKTALHLKGCVCKELMTEACLSMWMLWGSKRCQQSDPRSAGREWVDSQGWHER